MLWLGVACPVGQDAGRWRRKKRRRYERQSDTVAGGEQVGFQTPQFKIGTLLEWAWKGRVQLPDFQREYKWDDERIRQLLVTILRGHPMGVIMLLQTGSDQVRFKPKPIAGVHGEVVSPSYLLLDGQQRLTSMYQALTGDGIVETQDDRKKKLTRRYFVDLEKALGSPGDQDDAVLSLPADGRKKENFDRDIVLDVSTPELQYREGIMPVTELFGGDSTTWLLRYCQAVPEDQARRMKVFTEFQHQVVVPAQSYEVPAIELDNATTKEAVATVFEKVNTGGLALDVFELLTATFAGDADYYAAHGTDFRLADDWAKTEHVIAQHPVLGGLQRSDFLQAVTLLATNARREADLKAGKMRPAATSARREDILRLSLADYLDWAPQVRSALKWVAQFLTSQQIYAADFLPYRTQAVPLSAFRVLLGEAADVYGIKQRIAQWYWCGVLGELYGSTTETRFARDVEQVPPWAKAGVGGGDVAQPETVRVANFVESRLLSLKTRGSAAYKGVYALLMKDGCSDWLLDQQIQWSNYLEMQIDIHHVFPRAWCDKEGIDDVRRESIVNKTPLAKKTNIFLRGDSPAVYLPRLEAKSGLTGEAVDRLLEGHLIDSAFLRKANFDAFFDTRRAALLELISAAMGKPAVRDLDAATQSTDQTLAAVAEYDLEPDDPDVEPLLN